MSQATIIRAPLRSTHRSYVLTSKQGQDQPGLRRGDLDERRIASPELLPGNGPLPHLKCSPAVDAGGEHHEAGEHGDAR